MDAGDLLMLDAIIAEGGISAAAAKLGEPKTTVSRRLRRLEKAVGAPLFDRSGRRLRLTSLGRTFAAPAEAVRVALSEAHSLARGTHLGPTDHLRIASPMLFGHRILTPYLGQFLAEHPGVNATLQLGNIPLNPLRENFDLAIRIQRPVEPYLIVSQLAVARLRLFAVPSIAARVTTPDDLAALPAINTSNTELKEVSLDLAGDARNDAGTVRVVTMKVRCTVNDPEAACNLTLYGAGVAALPEFLASEHVAEGALAPILPHLSVGTVGIYAVLPPMRTSVPLVRSFIDGLRKEMSLRAIG